MLEPLLNLPLEDALRGREGQVQGDRRHGAREGRGKPLCDSGVPHAGRALSARGVTLPGAFALGEASLVCPARQLVSRRKLELA